MKMRGLGVSEASCRGETMHRFQPNEARPLQTDEISKQWARWSGFKPRTDVQPVESYKFGVGVFLIGINPPPGAAAAEVQGADGDVYRWVSDKGVKWELFQNNPATYPMKQQLQNRRNWK